VALYLGLSVQGVGQAGKADGSAADQRDEEAGKQF
jgi:hypothetical protein